MISAMHAYVQTNPCDTINCITIRLQCKLFITDDSIQLLIEIRWL